MRVLVVAGRVSRHPWSSGAMVARVVAGLVARAHAIDLCCQSIDDDAPFAGVLSIREFTPFVSGGSEFPPGFARWVRDQALIAPGRVSLSLTHRAPGHAWMPVDPDAGSFVASALERSRPGALEALVRHAGATPEAIVRAMRPHPRHADIRRVICVGAQSAEGASVLGRAALASGIIRAPITSELPLLDEPERHRLRARVRELLALAPTRTVIAVSFIHRHERSMAGLYSAVASLNPPGNPSRPPGPALIVLTREPVHAHAAALRARCSEHVRVLGATRSIAAVLAASDAIATPTPMPRGAFRAGSCSRFAADAIRSGLPVLALTASSGVAALGLSTPDLPVPGIVVSSPAAADWARALRQASDRAWLARASSTASRLAVTLEPKRLIDSVETALMGCVPGAGA